MSAWDIVGNIIVLLSILAWLVFFRSLKKLKQRSSLTGRDRNQHSSQQILGSSVEVQAIEQATAKVTINAPTTCPVCQQHTLDA